MLSEKKLSPEQSFDISDAMQAAAASALMLRREIRGSLSEQEYQMMVERETALRYDADRYRAVGIKLLANNGALTARNLISAIDLATRTIGATRDIRHALNILNRLVALSAAITVGTVQDILAQVAELKSTVKANA
jgi:hypothetical protein